VLKRRYQFFAIYFGCFSFKLSVGIIDKRFVHQILQGVRSKNPELFTPEKPGVIP
jgi:hypothetical protein